MIFFYPAATTATISPEQKLITVPFKNLLTISFEGGDITDVIKNQVEVVKSLNGNPMFVKPYFESVKSIIDHIAQTPTADEEAQIAKHIVDVLNTAIVFFKSQPGLENITTDQKLMADPDNFEFYKGLQGFEDLKTVIIQNPAYAFKYFTDSETAAAWAYMTVLCFDFSKRTQASATSTSKKCHVLKFPFYNVFLKNV
jgi:hypothetical protein